MEKLHQRCLSGCRNASQSMHPEITEQHRKIKPRMMVASDENDLDTSNNELFSLIRPSCQKKKCTCVKNRCIWSKISRDQGRPQLLRGWIECKIVSLTGSRWLSNYYITPATGSSDQLEERCWNENHVPAEVGPLGPRLSSPGERERKAVIARRVWGSISCSLCLVSHSLSHTTLSIK